MLRTILRNLVVLSFLPLTLAACADDESSNTVDTGDGSGDGSGAGEGSSEPADLEIAGLWADDFGTNHDITPELWTMAFAPIPPATESTPATFTVLSFDNPTRVAIARNGDQNEFSPGLFSRFDWAWVGTELYFCQTAYDAASADAAAATPAADPTDPATTGCGGFGWSRLTAR